MTARRYRLSGRAAAFLDLLTDYGHLTPDDVTGVLQDAGRALGLSVEAAPLLELPEVKRAAARWLFRKDPLRVPEGLLEEDWGLLFS